MASKVISDSDKADLLKLSGRDLCVSNISKLFGWTAKKIDGKLVRFAPKFNTMDIVNLAAGEYINKEAVTTTVGSVLWNKLFVEGTIDKVVPNGFINEEMTDKAFDKVLGYVEKGLRDQVLPIEPNLVNFLFNYEFYSMKLVTVFSPSYTKALFQTPMSIRKKKKELLATQKSDDVSEMVRIEDSLVAFSKEQLNNDEGMTLFKSGARGSFENDYKNMNLMVGPVKNEATGKYEFIKHGYLDGLEKEDLVAAGNIVVNSAYPKAVGTEVGGYLTKQFYAVYQSMMADPELEDCGTKQALDFVLTKDIANDFLYQYIQLPNGKCVLLEDDNVESFIGKRIKLRSPMFCASDKFCRHCIGELPRWLGIEAIGLTTGRISNTMLAKKMKIFHNAKMKFDDVNIDDLLI